MPRKAIKRLAVAAATAALVTGFSASSAAAHPSTGWERQTVTAGEQGGTVPTGWERAATVGLPTGWE